MDDDLPLNQGHHIGMTTEGELGKLYINGQLVKRGQVWNLSPQSRSMNYLSRSNWGNDGFVDGFLSDFRMYGRAIGAAETTSVSAGSFNEILLPIASVQGCFRNGEASGIIPDGLDCTDINEYVSRSHNCEGRAQCIDTSGSFLCMCNAGYENHDGGLHCTNVNECSTFLNPLRYSPSFSRPSTLPPHPLSTLPPHPRSALSPTSAPSLDSTSDPSPDLQPYLHSLSRPSVLPPIPLVSLSPLCTPYLNLQPHLPDPQPYLHSLSRSSTLPPAPLSTLHPTMPSPSLDPEPEPNLCSLSRPSTPPSSPLSILDPTSTPSLDTESYLPSPSLILIPRSILNPIPPFSTLNPTTA